MFQEEEEELCFHKLNKVGKQKRKKKQNKK